MCLPIWTRGTLVCWLLLLSGISVALTEEPEYVVATKNGKQFRVPDNRQPALYTADYGDCLGKSTINVTRFDAAYYKDNMTIIFHLAGETGLAKEDIMMNIRVFAYGESRFDLTFNPCSANIQRYAIALPAYLAANGFSACPVRVGIPIEAAGIIPVSQGDVAGIPELALSIPDFEGQAILRVFSNSTQNEIGCFAAQITNGNTFQQKFAASTILGGFTAVAVLSSLATAITGDDVLIIRKHYAHSLSVLVVFAVWHHIFFSGALSMNWPSVLVAFWSNYAWASGMIYSEHMQSTINNFIGSNKGNTSHVGAAGTGVDSPTLGGGYDIQQIYQRGFRYNTKFDRKLPSKRHLVDESNGFTYYGKPVRPGLPLPGNYSGFAGTLALERVPASNAFLTGFLWFLIILAGVTIFMITFKLVLEVLSRLDWIKKERLAFFRTHYRTYTALALLRTMLIGFFMLTFLTMFQYSYLALSAPVAVACVVFIAMLFGLGSMAAFTWYSRLDMGKQIFEADRLTVERKKVLRCLTWFAIFRESSHPRSDDNANIASVPWIKLQPLTKTQSIHDDAEFTIKFGWLASRYRRTRWWFFIIWLVYEFMRACLLAGASDRPIVQVSSLIGIEVAAFIAIMVIRPFEGQRINFIIVYFLGISKVTTAALSVAFDPRFGVPRIPATIIGIVIIVIQGLLTIVVMVAVVFGVDTSYMSIMRHFEVIEPKRWNVAREKYFKRMELEAQDVERSRPAKAQSSLEIPSSSYFVVNNVTRIAKIEDEDVQFMQEAYNNASTSRLSLLGPCTPGFMGSPSQRTRADSLQSYASHTSLPRAARLHRASWSPQYFGESQYSGPLQVASNVTTVCSAFGPFEITSPSDCTKKLLASASPSGSTPRPKGKRTSEEEMPSLPDQNSELHTK